MRSDEPQRFGPPPAVQASCYTLRPARLRPPSTSRDLFPLPELRGTKTMRTMPHRGVLLLAFAIGSAACDGRSPSTATPIPTPPSPGVPSAPTVTAIAPPTGSTVRPTPVMISGTGFLAGATVSVDVV